MHVQSVQEYCFSLSNMQICEVFVAVVVVVAYKLPNYELYQRRNEEGNAEENAISLGTGYLGSPCSLPCQNRLFSGCGSVEEY